MRRLRYANGGRIQILGYKPVQQKLKVNRKIFVKLFLKMSQLH